MLTPKKKCFLGAFYFLLKFPATVERVHRTDQITWSRLVLYEKVKCIKPQTCITLFLVLEKKSFQF